jgi:uncharacterized protein (TIGR02284 family)
MVTINNDVISTLVSLIEICKDGEIGYRNAAEKGRYPELVNVFSEYSRQRAQFIEELRREVERLGGQSENEETAARAMHRGAMILRSSTADRPGQMIAACEKGEDEAIRSYKSALNAPLPEETKQLIQKQYMKVQEAHERIRVYEVQNENDNIGSATDGAVD